MPRKKTSYNDGEDSGQVTEQPPDPIVKRPLRKRSEPAAKEKSNIEAPPRAHVKEPLRSQPVRLVKAKGSVATEENNERRKKNDEKTKPIQRRAITTITTTRHLRMNTLKRRTRSQKKWHLPDLTGRPSRKIQSGKSEKQEKPIAKND